MIFFTAALSLRSFFIEPLSSAEGSFVGRLIFSSLLLKSFLFFSQMLGISTGVRPLDDVLVCCKDSAHLDDARSVDFPAQTTRSHLLELFNRTAAR